MSAAGPVPAVLASPALTDWVTGEDLDRFWAEELRYEIDGSVGLPPLAERVAWRAWGLARRRYHAERRRFLAGSSVCEAGDSSAFYHPPREGDFAGLFPGGAAASGVCPSTSPARVGLEGPEPERWRQRRSPFAARDGASGHTRGRRGDEDCGGPGDMRQG